MSISKYKSHMSLSHCHSLSSNIEQNNIYLAIDIILSRGQGLLHQEQCFCCLKQNVKHSTPMYLSIERLNITIKISG